jgi:hypothetical protein
MTYDPSISKAKYIWLRKTNQGKPGNDLDILSYIESCQRIPAPQKILEQTIKFFVRSKIHSTTAAGVVESYKCSESYGKISVRTGIGA